MHYKGRLHTAHTREPDVDIMAAVWTWVHTRGKFTKLPNSFGFIVQSGVSVHPGDVEIFD